MSLWISKANVLMENGRISISDMASATVSDAPINREIQLLNLKKVLQIVNDIGHFKSINQTYHPADKVNKAKWRLIILFIICVRACENRWCLALANPLSLWIYCGKILRNIFLEEIDIGNAYWKKSIWKETQFRKKYILETKYILENWKEKHFH